MDQINCATADISTSVLPKTNRNEKISWPGDLSVKQNFSLLERIVYYMAKNPLSPKCYLKLAMSCKYFFEKNPLLVVGSLTNGKEICSSAYENECKKKNCCVDVDTAKLSSKIWLTRELLLSINDVSNIIPILHQKLYRYENAGLGLMFCKFTFDEFKAFASKFQKFRCYCVKITDNDGNDVMLETILEVFPSLKGFFFCFDRESPEATALTMKKILKLKNLGNLQLFYLRYVPELCALEDLYTFIMDHRHATIIFEFNSNISDQYKFGLDALIDVIITSKIHNRVIKYHGQDEEKLKIMKNHQHH